MSALEDKLLVQLFAADLPRPTREFRFDPVRKFRFDFAWPGARLAVEVQGGTYAAATDQAGAHSRRAGINRDCAKARLAVLNGWRLLPVTADDIRDGSALRDIAAALGYADDQCAVVTAVGAEPQSAITHARGAKAGRRERGREIRGAGVGPDGATQDDELTAQLTARVIELRDAGIGSDAAVLTARRELGLEAER